MISQSSSHPMHSFDRKTFVRFSIGLFIFAGFLSAGFLSNSVQDNRDQAAINRQTVEIVPVSSSGSNALTANQLSNINFQLNTHGTTIVGTQLVFTVSSNAIPALSESQLVVPANSGFVPLYKTVTPTSGGFLVRVAIRPNGQINSKLAYSSSSFVTVLQMSLLPNRAGNVTVSFDRSQTTSLTVNSVDVLQPIDTFTLQVYPGAEPSPILLVPTISVVQPTGTKKPLPTVKPGRMRGADPISPINFQ